MGSMGILLEYGSIPYSSSFYVLQATDLAGVNLHVYTEKIQMSTLILASLATSDFVSGFSA